jgi:MFS family permease
MSFGTLLPSFAKDVFRTDERGFSLLMTCNGLGALVSAATLAMGGNMRHKGKRLMLGAVLFSLSVVFFAFSPDLVWGCAALILAGWFLLTFLTTANTLVQTLAPDELRGRVFSLYSLALIGTSPIGALLVGTLAKFCGIREGVGMGAAFSVAFCVVLFLRCRSLWKKSEATESEKRNRVLDCASCFYK